MAEGALLGTEKEMKEINFYYDDDCSLAQAIAIFTLSNFNCHRKTTIIVPQHRTIGVDALLWAWTDILCSLVSTLRFLFIFAGRIVCAVFPRSRNRFIRSPYLCLRLYLRSISFEHGASCAAKKFMLLFSISTLLFGLKSKY